MKDYIKLLRPKHYLKNLLIFTPLFFSGTLFSMQLLINDLLGFIAFSFLSSVVYIVNDIHDVNEDRMHVTKKNRPIASGKIAIKQAVLVAIVLLLLSVLISYAASSRFISMMIFLLYFGVNLLYSVGGLKNVALIDILILTSGFLLRLYYGAIITSISISPWLYLTVIVLSFYLGLGKRRNELRICETNGQMTRPVLRNYTANFLDRNMYMCMSLAIAFYSLWCVDVDTIAKYGTNSTLWTIPLVIIMAMKYSLTIEGNSDGDPIEVVFKDKVLLILATIYAILMFWIIYI